MTDQESSATQQSPRFVAVGGVFIDDIVYPDGRTRMEVLGGGAVHAAAGMWLWDERPGAAIVVGRDASAAVQQRLHRDFDPRGLHWLTLPQARAWQLFEWDGTRRELFRVKVVDPYIDLPYAEHCPSAYLGAAGVYLLKDAQSLAEWRRLYPRAVLFWEPLQQYMIPANSAAFRAHVGAVEIVSPNLLEASQIYGFDAPDRLLDAMLNDGAKTVALRMGADGSMVASQTERHHIPAVPLPEVIDQTGAGNTYCGAFLVGYVRTGDLFSAGCYGAVAASFALESVGVIDEVPGMAARREARLSAALAAR